MGYWEEKAKFQEKKLNELKEQMAEQIRKKELYTICHYCGKKIKKADIFGICNERTTKNIFLKRQTPCIWGVGKWTMDSNSLYFM